nr:MAG TPA: hypothetical protein [Caudoviricetes sp.]
MSISSPFSLYLFSFIQCAYSTLYLLKTNCYLLDIHKYTESIFPLLRILQIF